MNAMHRMDATYESHANGRDSTEQCKTEDCMYSHVLAVMSLASAVSVASVE